MIKNIYEPIYEHIGVEPLTEEELKFLGIIPKKKYFRKWRKVK